jgi:hypothetical protein
MQHTHVAGRLETPEDGPKSAPLGDEFKPFAPCPAQEAAGDHTGWPEDRRNEILARVCGKRTRGLSRVPVAFRSSGRAGGCGGTPPRLLAEVQRKAQRRRDTIEGLWKLSRDDSTWADDLALTFRRR